MRTHDCNWENCWNNELTTKEKLETFEMLWSISNHYSVSVQSYYLKVQPICISNQHASYIIIAYLWCMNCKGCKNKTKQV